MPTNLLRFCTRAEVESLWSATAVLRAVDDDEDGALSPEEAQRIDHAVERASAQIAAALEPRYALADLASSAWCRDAAAVLAAALLAERRGNPPPPALAAARERLLAELEDIRRGRRKVPALRESRETIPTVTNFDTDLFARRAKVRRVPETSTGSPPPAGRRSFPE